MAKCPSCKNEKAYLGFSEVLCPNSDCEHFNRDYADEIKEKERAQSKADSTETSYDESCKDSSPSSGDCIDCNISNPNFNPCSPSYNPSNNPGYPGDGSNSAPSSPPPDDPTTDPSYCPQDSHGADFVGDNPDSALKVGNIYHCTEDLIGLNNERRFIKGKLYAPIRKNTIVCEQGWDYNIYPSGAFFHYFKRITELIVYTADFK